MPVTRHPLLMSKPDGPSIAVDAEAINRLEASLTTLQCRGPRIADRFYQALFEQAPSLRGAFPADIAAQHRKLIDMLVAVVTRLKDPDGAGRLLNEVGVRHTQYGARPEHYVLVRKLLLEAMAAEYGREWTGQLEVEWSQALELVSNAMIEAGREKPSAG